MTRVTTLESNFHFAWVVVKSLRAPSPFRGRLWVLLKFGIGFRYSLGSREDGQMGCVHFPFAIGVRMKSSCVFGFEIEVGFGIDVGFELDMGSKHHQSVILEVNKYADHFVFGRNLVKNVRLFLCCGCFFWYFFEFLGWKEKPFFTKMRLFE